MDNENKYIWLFGENVGTTADNNSYFFWKQIVTIDDEIEKYFIIEKNPKTQKVYESLTEDEKKYIIWKDSKKHNEKYEEADLLFVTLSYKDVFPEKLTDEKRGHGVDKPIIYLQHGTIGMKYVDYKGTSYWNNMVRFFTYSPKEFDYLTEKNDFKKYQIYYAQYPPRYIELYKKSKKTKKQILWFITWREYFGDNPDTREFTKHVASVLNDSNLKNYLKENKITLTLCVHQFFDGKVFKDIFALQEEGVIKIVTQQSVDIMKELAESEMLITDYSSVAFDFTFLNKPVLLYQPDLEVYISKRKFYSTEEEMKENNIQHTYDLVKQIISGKREINPFFREAYPENIDYDYIEQGKHIDKMYDYFKDFQLNKITFLGYNFNSVTNDTNSVFSLAEGLLEKGYLVEMISLLRPHPAKQKMPYGMNIKYLWNFEEDFRQKLSRLPETLKPSEFLKYELKDNMLSNYVEKKIIDRLKTMKNPTAISTETAMHLILNKYASNNVKNKLYLFNDLSHINTSDYSKIMEKLKKITLEKVIFTSPYEISSLEDKFNYTQYKSKLLLDSFPIDSKMLDLINLDSEFFDENLNIINPYPEDSDEGIIVERYDALMAYQHGVKRAYVNLHPHIREYDTLKIAKIEKKEIYQGITFIDFNSDDGDSINNLIDYGVYLKENKIENIIINAYGNGRYEDEFLDMIEKNDLFNIINFREFERDPIPSLRNHDFVVSFSTHPIHNLEYIEGILNYKKVFCIKNTVSEEVMDGISNSFIESYEWLTNQISNLDKISIEELRDNYLLICERYSKSKSSQEFLNFLNH